MLRTRSVDLADGRKPSWEGLEAKQALLMELALACDITAERAFSALSAFAVS